ncbi:MAG: DPP IV N-terminal domain-containing protein, partial [Pyrinomonadaceae bacterium]
MSIFGCSSGRIVLTLALLCGALPFHTFGQEESGRPVEARPYFYEPAISPDRSEIAFVSGGDIWTVPSSGGDARLLVSHPATEYRPVYSPDGRRLAFTSARTGNGDVYVLTLDTGDLKRLTFDDGFEQIESWSRDGAWVYFSSTARDISASSDIYRVRADGGTPMQISADRYANEFMSSPSPDGQSLAFVGRGYTQWWRHGHAHIDESQIMLMRNYSTASYEPLTEGSAKELWPMWGADARTLLYVSDKGGAENIWSQPPGGGRAHQVTSFTDGRVLWPTISYDGRTIVFERGFGIWKLDVSGGRAEEVRIV